MFRFALVLLNYLSNKLKAEILLEEFKSVFTHENKSHIPILSGPSYPTLPDLNFSEEGVLKLLKELNPNKAFIEE